MPAKPAGPTNTIQLSTGTWLKLIVVLIVHTAFVVWGGSRIVASIEERLVRVETNQEYLIHEYRKRK